jgi:hypothetical protein
MINFDGRKLACLVIYLSFKLKPINWFETLIPVIDCKTEGYNKIQTWEKKMI